mmetsp:Transcript_13132/g.19786  ORF Transcript_13132/g.19786 Transcript_13132/m.19786 type:complete len:171 (+) Transcript_13132:15-527(+)
MSINAPDSDQGSSSGLHQCECSMKLYISPAYLMDPMAGVQSQLSHMLLKYTPQLRGVPLAFSKVDLVSDTGFIRHDEPDIHLQASISVLVFAPALHQQLVGVVTRMSGDHVALLVHGAFNASIIKQSDVSADAATKLVVGQQVHFVLKSITVADGLLSMLGELPQAYYAR